MADDDDDDDDDQPPPPPPPTPPPPPVEHYGGTATGECQLANGQIVSCSVSVGFTYTNSIDAHNALQADITSKMTATGGKPVTGSINISVSASF